MDAGYTVLQFVHKCVACVLFLEIFGQLILLGVCVSVNLVLQAPQFLVTTACQSVLKKRLWVSHFKVAVQACNHEITRYFKAYLIQTRSTDGNKLYIK